jgi:hypothetical protein
MQWKPQTLQGLQWGRELQLFHTAVLIVLVDQNLIPSRPE